MIHISKSLNQIILLGKMLKIYTITPISDKTSTCFKLGLGKLMPWTKPTSLTIWMKFAGARTHLSVWVSRGFTPQEEARVVGTQTVRQPAKPEILTIWPSSKTFHQPLF